jgi:hypothetical protein
MGITMMEHLTMSELESLGFEIVKSYEHDEWMTQRRQKGCITVETTWLKSGEFVTQDLWVDESVKDEFTIYELTILDKILNQ